MAQIKVLLISPLPPPRGGIATWTEQVRQSLRPETVELHILDSGVRWRNPTRQPRVVRLLGGSVHALWQIGVFVLHLVRTRPHVIHLCTSAQFALAKDCMILLFCRLACRSAIIHFRFGRIPLLGMGNSLEWRLLKLAVKLSHRAIVLDQLSYDSLQKRFPGKVAKIPNLVRPIHREQGRVRCHSICFVGHGLRSKGCSELVSACVALRQRWPDLTLRMVGPFQPEYLRELQKLAGGDSNWLAFDGELSHDAALSAIAECELFVLPSYTEGFPNVILEAMSLGKPIVATNVGAVPEMLAIGTPEECGVCVPHHDPDALAKAIGELLSDECLAKRLAGRAKTRCVREYSVDAVIGRLVALWREAHLQGRGA